MIGSRNATDRDLTYSRDLGALAARQGYSIVSGGARGVDEAAMLGALEAEGTVIGVLADNLLRSSSSARYRSYLMANNLVLISTFYPEAGFNAGNAMQRNKYFYCLCDAAVAVHSGTKGGTWSGALENLKNRWTPLWVKRITDCLAGNLAIVKAGAAWVPESIREFDFASLFKARMIDTAFGDDLFSRQAGGVKDGDTEERPATSSTNACVEFYDLFLLKVQIICSDSTETADELASALELNKTQLNAWLKRAVSDLKLKKLPKPVRYQWVTTQQGTLPL